MTDEINKSGFIGPLVIESKESIEATEEILADKALPDGIKKGIDDLNAGRCRPWREVRKKENR